MDLNTITEIGRPGSRGEFQAWRAGDAWLAGGTWLFSEPQPALTRLIDLAGLGWPALETKRRGAAYWRHLHAGAARRGRISGRLAARRRCSANAAAPAWVIQDLECGDGGREFVHGAAGRSDGGVDHRAGRRLRDLDAGRGRARGARGAISLSGRNKMRCGPGSCCARSTLPSAALRRRTAFRQISLTPLGRSAALLVGTLAADGGFAV